MPFVDVDYDPFAAPAGGSGGAPGAAAPTPLQAPGQMPPGTAPGRLQAQPDAPDASMVPLSADAQRAQKLMRVNGLMGNRSGVQDENDILQADPTYEARKNQAVEMGKNAAILAGKQAAGSQILTGVDRLQDILTGADDKTVKSAMGPYNLSMVHPYTVVPTSPTAYLAPQEMTPVQAAAAYNPNDTTNAAYDFQNRINHLVGGLTEQFVASTGGAANNMSDSRQRVFEETMGALRNATSKDEALKIVGDARNIIRDTFNLHHTPNGSGILGDGPSPAIAAPQATKTLNGITYVKINGHWYQQ